MKQLRNSLLLLLTAMIWGSAFVAQSVGMDHLGPMTFNGVRNIFAFIFLLIMTPVLDKLRDVKKQEVSEAQRAIDHKNLLIGGIACGLVLGIASLLQQAGIVTTSVGKASFITALYIVLVPILGIFLKKKPPFIIWVGVVLAVIGLYMLTMTESLTLATGDILVILCALAFSVHILVIDHFSPLVDGVRLARTQFLVAAFVNLIPALIFEEITLTGIISGIVPLLYTSILSSGVGYTLQIIAQNGLNPTVASLIMSLESVFGALFGWLILHQVLSAKELTGCILVFAAVILVQLPIGQQPDTADTVTE